VLLMVDPHRGWSISLRPINEHRVADAVIEAEKPSNQWC